jgi:hypothetical protein
MVGHQIAIQLNVLCALLCTLCNEWPWLVCHVIYAEIGCQMSTSAITRIWTLSQFFSDCAENIH